MKLTIITIAWIAATGFAVLVCADPMGAYVEYRYEADQ